jgi:tRNA pseudouridine32 synthase / 23S rRNA pseudouridine746 synthase
MTTPAPKPLFQSEHWLAVDKPACWLTTPARQGADDPRPCLGRILEKESGARIFPVHRLDFEVSGLVLFALTAEAHRAANGWFEKHLVEKTYVALAGAGPVPPEFFESQLWRTKLVRGKRRTFAAEHGQEAITEAKCISRHESGRSTWELKPKTGRPHQLRYEMAHHGFPILGDTLYGGSEWRRPGIALRATGLDFSKIEAGERHGLPVVLQAEGWERAIASLVPE